MSVSLTSAERAALVSHPSLGVLDGYQWLLFVAHHTDQRTSQLEELRETVARS